MGAMLGDPYLLASYNIPSVSGKGKGKEVAGQTYVFASHSNGPKHDEDQVTLAVQGDGVHVYELGDMHPVSSRTFGPSVQFASAPSSVTFTKDKKVVRMTYVAVLSSPELKNEDARRVIWAWRDDATGDIGTSQDKLSARLSHHVSYLLTPHDLDSVIAISGSGQVTIMDVELNVKNSWSSKDNAQVKKIFIYPRQECRFLPRGHSASECILLVFVECDKKLRLYVVVIGVEGEMTVLEPIDVPSADTDDIADISCEPLGFMSVLGCNGTWASYLLELRHSSTIISLLAAPLHVKALDFVPAKGRRPSNQISILSLGSSFVLLAGTISKDIALLLWDIRYGVLLRSATVPIPNAMGDAAGGVSLYLTGGGSSQTLLILSPTANLKHSNQLRSGVLVVPFTVPKRSSLANAMGKAEIGEPWVVASPSGMPPRDADICGKNAMLLKLQEAILERRTKHADNIFFDWLKGRGMQAKGENLPPPAAPGTHHNGQHGQQDLEIMEKETFKEKEKKPPVRSLLDYGFVARVLSAVLVVEPEDRTKGIYSPNICRYLVTKQVVSHSMVKKGLIHALTQYNDWESVRECFTNVVDLPEGELIRSLHFVVRHHRGQPTFDNDAMAVDEPKRKSRVPSWSGVPSITAFLAYVVDYPASPVAWRTAIREYFKDAEDLMTLLVIVENWLRVFATKNLPLSLDNTNEHGVSAADHALFKKPSRTKDGELLPSLENLLTFLQALLDSSLLNLLQDAATHPLLQRVSEIIGDITAENLQLETLRGPLDPFVRIHSKMVAEDAGSWKKREDVDWRKRRKQAHEQTAINLGPYQVEELIF